MSESTLPTLNWSLTPTQILKETQNIINQTNELYNQIISIPKDQRTKENTFLAFISPPNFKNNPLVSSCKFPSSVSTNSEIREASRKAKTLLSQFRVACSSRPDIYHVLKEWNQEFGEQQLSIKEKYVMKNILKDFERNGLALKPEERQKLIELKKQESELGVKFTQNLAENNAVLYFTDEELVGTPTKFIQSLPKNDNNQRILTLSYPHLIPVLEMASNDETRKRMALARESLCYETNLPLVAQAVKVRKESAQLLGYPSYSHYILEKRMAKKPETVMKFLDDLEEKLREKTKKDYQTLLELKRKTKEELGEPFDGELHPWELSYYQTKHTSSIYGVSEDEIRNYFPIQSVIDQTLEIYQHLLSLRFEEVKKGEFSSWHTDVQLYRVYDKESNLLIGFFYLDLYPREGKYGHAAIFHLVKRAPNQVPVESMVTNLTKPTATEPSLLSHKEVVTFFHEFGHIMHNLCSENHYNMNKFAKCPKDFVEAPSQMLENWCCNPEVLRKISSHYQTGEKLPNNFIEYLIKSKNTSEPIRISRQIYLSKLDMIIHSENPPNDLQQLVDELRPKITLVKNPPKVNTLTTFGHIMRRYMAAYYGYLYSRVMSADMFSSRFEKEGVMNQQTGYDYRKKILEPGGMVDPEVFLADFIGRSPEIESFLESIGVN